MPRPHKGESKKSYVQRCVVIRQREYPKEDPNQSIAVCYSMYRKHKKDK